MIRLRVVLFSFSMAASISAWAQAGAPLQAPLLGYAPDAGQIRPVYGISAAAVAAPALDFGGDFVLSAISPRHDYVLGSTGSGVSPGEVMLAIPGSGASPLPGAESSPDRIVLSPSGSAAALWFASSGNVQIFSGLPGSPAMRELSAAFLSVSPSALAVSDDGAWVAGAWPEGIYLFGPHGETRRLPLRERVGALAFYISRPDLAVATRLHVFSFADVGGAAALATLYEGGPWSPVGLAISSGNRDMVLADASGKILDLDLSSGSNRSFDCGCAPQGVFSMGGGVFRLTGIDQSTFKIFDAGAAAVFLVPLADTAQPGAALKGGAQ